MASVTYLTPEMVQTAWLAVLPPINEIIKLGVAGTLKLPYTLDAFAPATETEPEQVFVFRIVDPIIDQRRSDALICGTVPSPTGKPKPQPPELPFRFFLFDCGGLRHVLAKMERNPTGQLRMLKFEGSEWVGVWSAPFP